MIYLYGNEDCPNCKKKEKELKDKGIPFEKRDAARMKAPEDDIDQDALIEASMQNLVLPVIVER